MAQDHIGRMLREKSASFKHAEPDYTVVKRDGQGNWKTGSPGRISVSAATPEKASGKALEKINKEENVAREDEPVPKPLKSVYKLDTGCEAIGRVYDQGSIEKKAFPGYTPRPARPSEGPSIRRRLQNFIGSGIGGAVTGALGTSAILGAGSILTRGKLPMLGKMLGEAGVDGLKIFNPKRAWSMAKATPEGTKLFGREMDLVTKAERAAAGGRMNPSYYSPAEVQNMKKLQKDVAAFTKLHGMSPQDSVTRMIGGISGVASAGAGAIVGGYGGLTKDANFSVRLIATGCEQLKGPNRGGDAWPEKSAAIAQKDLKYWGQVNDAVAKKVEAGQDPTKVGVIGSCGHSIRKGPTPVKIGKKCFTCVKADDMGKAANVRSTVLGGYAYTTPTGKKKVAEARMVTPAELRRIALTGETDLDKVAAESTVDSDDLAAGLHQQRDVEVGFDQVGDPPAQDDVPAGVGLRGVQAVGTDNVGVAARARTSEPSLVARFGLPLKHHRLPSVKAATILTLPHSNQILDRNVALPSLTLGARLDVTQDGHEAPLQGMGYPSPASGFLFKPASSAGTDTGLAAVTDERSPALRKVIQGKSPTTLLAGLPPRFELGNGSIPPLRKDAGVLGPLSNLLSNRFGQVDLHFHRPAARFEKVAAFDKVEPLTSKPAPLRESSGTPVLTTQTARDVERRVDLSQAFSKLARYRRFHHAENNPSPAQVKAKNYKMGHLDFQGLDITIENEKGSIRRGVDAGGKKWESTLACPYGYIRSVPSGESGKRIAPKAADGDHLDVFIGPDRSSDLVVVIDQYFSGKYDESKFVLGCRNQDQAVKLYRSNYQRGWPEMPVSTTTVPQLKKWMKCSKATGKPFKGQLVKAASPKWAKMLGKLSPASLERLKGGLPAATRQVSKKPFGHGSEGHVFDAFTGGGVGDSVVKVFRGTDSVAASRMQTLAKNWTPPKIQMRADTMRANPDIFPEVYGNSPRSIAMERLTELPAGTVKDFYKNLWGARDAAQRRVSRPTLPKGTLWERLTGVAKQKRQKVMDDALAEARLGRRPTIREHVQQLRQSPIYDLMRKSVREDVAPGQKRHGISGLAEGSHSSMYQELTRGGRKITDFGITGSDDAHNIMLNRHGRAVISDPLVKELA